MLNTSNPLRGIENKVKYFSGFLLFNFLITFINIRLQVNNRRGCKFFINGYICIFLKIIKAYSGSFTQALREGVKIKPEESRGLRG